MEVPASSLPESRKLDYLMLPPPLWDQAQHVEVERRGIWAPSTVKSFDTVTSKWNRASDHAPSTRAWTYETRRCRAPPRRNPAPA
jgi:hypothetical protein